MYPEKDGRVGLGSVDKPEAVQRLVAACPGFAETWNKHRANWGLERAGDYNDLGVLALWLVDQMAGGRLDCFPELFGELELLLAAASEEVRDLLVVGFLEDLQNIAANRQIDPDLALNFLGTESRRGWFELIRSWHGPTGTGWPGQRAEP
jgi:hypothetical protein